MRYVLSCLVTLAMLGVNASAEAQIFRNFAAHMNRDFRRNNNWPHPFVGPNRAAVRAPFRTMVANGWRLQNTLGDHHFDAETGKLTEAGELRVRSILTENAEEHRSLFVLHGRNKHQSEARLESVREFSSQVLAEEEDENADISLTTVRPHGWPADYIDDIGEKFRESTPSPRLPASTTGSSSSSSSGSK